MKKIRKGVFETNSSSCHTISIVEGMVYNDIPSPDYNGVIYINSGEFGWEQEVYHDFYNKATYLAIYIRDWSGEKLEEFKNIFEFIIKDTTGCNSIKYEKSFWETEEVYYDETVWNSVTKTQEKTGNKLFYIKNLGEGYIDHQSVEDKNLHYLFEDTNKMKSFLFNSGSYLQTDNDNH